MPAHGDVVWHSGAEEWAVQLQPPTGSGSVHGYRLRAGLLLYIGDFTPSRPVQLDWQLAHEPLLELHLHLAGTYRSTFDHPGGAVHIGPDLLLTTDLRHATPSGRIDYPAGMRQLQIELILLADELQRTDAPWGALAPADAGSGRGGAGVEPAPLQPALRATALQLLDCPFDGAARRLFLESKGLEILAHAVGARSSRAVASHGRLRRADIERIERAREILLARIDAPPRLEQLAALVGMSDWKLKQGFRQVFNTTVFGALHRERMQQARVLLLDGQLSVLEVALRVGYVCPSRFSAAFRRSFGCRPSELRRGLRESSATAHNSSGAA